MEEMSTLCGYEENVNDVKNKLIFATLELESVKMKADMQSKENEKTVQHLIGLLSIAYQERDEARDHLQKLIRSLSSSGTPDQLSTNVLNPYLQQPQSPLSLPPINLSISGSNSETYTHLSNGSSPVDSFFDSVPTADLVNMNVAGSSNMSLLNHPAFVQDVNGSTFTGLASAGENNVKGGIDRANARIEKLVEGKDLPQLGNLLQTVMDSGPLLQSIFITGLLPQWQNPPPCLRALGVQGVDRLASPNINRKRDEKRSCVIPKPLISPSGACEKHHSRSLPAIQEPMSKFLGGPSSGLSYRQTSSSVACNSSQGLLGKRKMT